MLALTGLILAGGRSRRMGKDKASLIYQGQTLVDKQIGLLHSFHVNPIFVSCRKNQILPTHSIKILHDELPDRGPIEGLRIGLKTTPTTHLVVLAVDMPFIQVDFLNKLYQQCEPNRGIVPISNSGIEPLCAIYPTSSQDILSEYLSSSDKFSIIEFISHCIKNDFLSTYTALPEEQINFTNWNNPTDVFMD